MLRRINFITAAILFIVSLSLLFIFILFYNFDNSELVNLLFGGLIGAAITLLITSISILVKLYVEYRVENTMKERPDSLELMKKARRYVTLLGISLYDIHENKEKFEKIVDELATKKWKTDPPIKFKFLYMNPNKSCIRKREVEEDGKKTGRLINEVNQVKKTLKQIKYSYRDNKGVEFKYGSYNYMPKYSLIWIDDVMYVGPYMHTKGGVKTSWEYVSIKNIRKRAAYDEEFERVWNTRNRDSEQLEII